jgi:hypothetical protein
MRRRAVLLAVALAAQAWAWTACTGPAPDPLKLDGNLLTVENRSGKDWQDVEIWLNYYYRVTARSIPDKTTFQAPLDTFVAGFGQRFNYHRMQVKDLRLVAKLPDGSPLEIKKQFQVSGLELLKGGKP